MRTLSAVLSIILTWLLPVPMHAEETLVDLAAAKRHAYMELAVSSGTREMIGSGVFISGEGLALVDLGSIALKSKPEVVTSDGVHVPFGSILGIFPDQELALMKFKHSPKVWLSLAPREPDVGEKIAFVTLPPENQRNAAAPPVVGPVMAIRSEISANLRASRFVRVLSLGAGLSRQQSASIGPGCFAINRSGELVAIRQSTLVEGRQAFILLSPVVGLADQIGRFVDNAKPVPFPLSEADNPIDGALLDDDFHTFDLALQQGDRTKAARFLEKLIQRYPMNQGLKTRAASAQIMGSEGPLAGLADLSDSGPEDSTAGKFRWHEARASSLAAKNDLEGAIRECRAAEKLCPGDYPAVWKKLLFLNWQLSRHEEAEACLRKALASNPEDFILNEWLEKVLIQQKKFEEADKVSEKIYELEEIYRAR